MPVGYNSFNNVITLHLPISIGEDTFEEGYSIFALSTNFSNQISESNATEIPFDKEQLLRENLGEKRKDFPSVLVLTIVYTLIFLSGVVGNVATCLVIAKNNYMHTVTNYYLFSLAVSDTIILVLGK